MGHCWAEPRVDVSEARPIHSLEETRVGSSLGHMSSTHWIEGAYDTSTHGTAQQRPIPVKGPARLTWLKGGGPARGKPVNDLFAYSPFTAR